MNRMESPAYPNTISGVVYQSGQFAPTWDGSLSRVLQSGPVSLCYQVAQEALGGARLGIRKRMLPVPKRKYRCVRDQRWGKCIFLNPVPVDVRLIHSQDRIQKRYLLIFTSKYPFLYFFTHYSLQETVQSILHNLPHLFHLLPLQACAYNEAGLIPIPSVLPDLKNESYLHPYN